MGISSLFCSKAILAICNFCLLACGFLLITGGMLVLFDTDRILLSKLLTSDEGYFSSLPEPFIYYIAIGLASLGLLLSSTGVLGCWASCLHNYCLLSTYFLIIMLVLVGECIIYAIAWAWPHCLGLGVESTDLVKILQRDYGTVGKDQFTVAVDLAQTMFNCCGVNSAVEYDTSLWQLQGLAPNKLAIPLSCCKLANNNDTKAYLNPIPINTILCQALEANRHEGYRHLQGCNDFLQQWYREHYLIFLAIGLIAVLIEFFVLLSIILMCTRIYKYKQKAKESIRQNKKITAQNSYQRRAPLGAYMNETYAMTDSFRHNYKLGERA